MKRVKNGAVLAAALALAACATARPPPPPVLEYVRTSCDASPDVASATSLTPDRARAQFVVNTPVTAATHCLTREDGGVSPYQVYALPADPATKTITIGAAVEMARIFAPQISVLDANGVVTRSFDRAQYAYRGYVYSVQFRPHEGEAFVLVTADPTLVGQRYDSVFIGTQTASTYAAGVTVSWTSGVDNAQSRTFSYEGGLQAIVYDSAAGH